MPSDWHEVGMVSALDDLAPSDVKNDVSINYGRQSVCDDDWSPAWSSIFECFFNDLKIDFSSSMVGHSGFRRFNVLN